MNTEEVDSILDVIADPELTHISLCMEEVRRAEIEFRVRSTRANGEWLCHSFGRFLIAVGRGENLITNDAYDRLKHAQYIVDEQQRDNGRPFWQTLDRYMDMLDGVKRLSVVDVLREMIREHRSDALSMYRNLIKMAKKEKAT